jgi:hypothetical protein
MTPRKLFALLNVHVEIERAKNGGESNNTEQVGYIDTIPGW